MWGALAYLYVYFFIMQLNQPGIDINAVDELGRTPLHLGAAEDNPECVRLLVWHVRSKQLAAGADTSKVNNKGATALHIAAFNGHVKATTSLV